MKRNRSSLAGIAVVLVCMTGLANVVIAASGGNPAGTVPRPAIPKGQGESCVKETEFMRRNHMDMLMHQRDETVLKGLRSSRYSLKECINCHAVYGPDAIALTSASPQHFCRSCHDYAAVNIDCFQCHASRPETGIAPAGDQLSRVSPAVETLNGSHLSDSNASGLQ